MSADGEMSSEPAVVAPPWVRGLDAPPGTAWTRADALRVDDLVSIGDNTVDRLARIVTIERLDQEARVRLHLVFAIDGAALARCVQTPSNDARYLRRLPPDPPEAVVPVTTVAGLETAWRISDRDWGADGSVTVTLPVRVADRLLVDRGWIAEGEESKPDRAWSAPSGERFSGLTDAVWFALTADYADASAAAW